MKNSETRIKLDKSIEIREVLVIETIVIRDVADVDMIVAVVAIIEMIEAEGVVGTTIVGMIGVAVTDVDEEMIAQVHVVLIVAEIRMKDRILQEVDTRNLVILIINHVITGIAVDIHEVEADPVDAVDHSVVQNTITIEMTIVVVIITNVVVIVAMETVGRAAVDEVAAAVVVLAAVVVAAVLT